MKPFIALVALVFALAACGGTAKQAAKSSAPIVASSSAASSSAAPAAAATTAPAAKPSAPTAKPSTSKSPTPANSGPATTAPPAASLSGPLLPIRPPGAQAYGVIEPTRINVSPNAHVILDQIHWTAWTPRAAWGWGDLLGNTPTRVSITAAAIPAPARNNMYNYLSWSSGSGAGQTTKLQDDTLILAGSQGGKEVGRHATPPAPTTAPPAPTTCAHIPAGDYRDPTYLASAVARTICNMFGPPPPATTCKLVSGLKFSCTAALRTPWTGDVNVSPDGKEFNIPNPPQSP